MNWPTQKLETVADFCLGKMLDQKKNRGEHLPYLANVNVRWGEFDLADLREMRFEQHELDRYGLKYGDIVMCEGGEPGRCAIWKEQHSSMMIQKALHRIRPHDCLRPEFLYYFFLHKGRTGHLASLFTGSTIKHLPREKLALVEVPVPPRSTQDQIASVLSAYDDLIESNRRRIQLLEQAARLLYKEWFVHLRFPGHEHSRIIDGVPEGWEKTTFGDAVENFDRLRIPLSVMEREKRPGSFPYHGAAGILDHLDGFIFEGRFLLVGEDGTVVTQGNTAMLQLVEGKFWVSNHAHVVQGQLVSTEYLFCFMSHYPITGHITGVAQPKLSQRNLNRISMLIPPANLLDMFQDSAEPMFNQIFNLKAVCDRLAKARDLLLPKLMNGEVAV